MPLTNHQVRRNKVYMTIVHYLLTYPRWSFSLFVLLAGKSLPLPSYHEAVRVPHQRRVFIREQEAALYENCTRQAFDTMFHELNESTQAEIDRATSHQVRNHERLQEAHRIDRQVRQSLRTAREMLRASPWILGDDNSIDDDVQNPSNNATNNDTASTQWLACPDASTQQRWNDYWTSHQWQEAVSSDFDGYLDATQQTLQYMARYARERSRYDYHYFVGIKINQTLELLEGIDLDLDLNVSTSLNLTLARMNLALDPLRLAMMDMRAKLESMNLRLTAIHTSLEGFYVNYLEIFGRLESLKIGIYDAFDGFRSPEWIQARFPELDLGSVPFGATLLPVGFPFPPVELDLPDVDLLLTDALSELTRLLAELIVDITRAAVDASRKVMEELYEILKELLTLEDYNPPQYVSPHAAVGQLEDEAAFLDTVGQNTKQSIDDALETTSAFFEDQTLGDLDNEPRSAPDPIDTETTSFGYLEPRFPEFSFPDLMSAILTFLIKFRWLVELLVQSFRFWKLKRKYERNATPVLPVIDYAGPDEGPQREREQEKKSAYWMVAICKHFTTPWMALGLVLTPILLFFIVFWFPHVKGRCMESRRGTFIANYWTAPLDINRANLPGNTLHVGLEMKCSRQLQALCSGHVQASDRRQTSDTLVLESLQESFAESTEIKSLFAACLDVGALDDEVEHACCGLDGYTNCESSGDPAFCPIDNLSSARALAYRPLGEYLEREAFASAMDKWSLDDGVFNCSVIEDSCSIPVCDGANRDLIRQAVAEADCSFHTYGIMCCTLVLVALFHAIALNVCCSLLLDGFKHLWWRQITPNGGVKLHTHVNADGDLVKGGDKAERAERMNRAMRRYEQMGWIKFWASSVFFCCWFIAFFVIRRRLIALFDLK